MKASLTAKLFQLAERLEEISQLLAREDATADLEKYRKLSREHAELTPVVALFQAYRKTEADAATAQTFLSDPDMKAFAQAD
jgi:peptide chain release factor 1